MGVTFTDTGSGLSKSKSLFISQLGAATRSINAQIKKTIIQVNTTLEKMSSILLKVV
jgi:hypothetical protein